LPFIALTAAAAPLLGLLGTVTGMIKTFNLITIFGTGDAKSLSSGISEALITTALGLVIAIPALIAHGMLARMARQKLGDMEQTAVGFINGVVGVRNKDK
jgi:biopolymer transport protein ExbB